MNQMTKTYSNLGVLHSYIISLNITAKNFLIELFHTNTEKFIEKEYVEGKICAKNPYILAVPLTGSLKTFLYCLAKFISEDLIVSIIY